MSGLRSLIVGVVAAVTLAACVSQPVQRAAVPVDPMQARANDDRREAVHDWGLEGRIAVSNGERGGSGRIDWQQRAGGYTIALSAPVTRQSWQLIGDDRGARLEGIAGGPREDADVELLLLRSTGWNIPVRALQDWVRGIGAVAHEYGQAKIVYGPGGVPAKLEQAGWSIEYEEWHAATTERPQLPRRIVARNGNASVKLIIDSWAL
ncbi:lipoprotein insertase outer membrane protein LolB [Lysobacter tyrosinilyticus]